MYYFLLALLTAVIATVPFLLRKRLGAAIGFGITAFVMNFFIFALSNPSLAFPLGGAVAVITVLELWLSGIICAISEYYQNKGYGVMFLPPVAGTLLLLITLGSGCSMWRSADYAAQIGTITEREWTKDMQPKSPEHVRLVPLENANYIAGKQLGGPDGALGSQFSVATQYTTLQMIHGELWYVVPLDFKGFFPWKNARTAPGYILVHAEDPDRVPITRFKERFAYTPGAFFGHDLHRHLWLSGYARYGMTDFTPEVDERGKLWWVVTLYKPTIGWSGPKVAGIVVVDPVDGDIKPHPHGTEPHWIDRVVPDQFVQTYVNNWGKFRGGWSNATFAHRNIVEGETPAINYGSDGEPYWVVPLTSNNASDQSLVGLLFVNSRTGRVVKYHTRGSTEAAILQAVDNRVNYMHRHGAGPVIYNIYGTLAALVPVLGANHTYQGVAIVNVDNIQHVAIGDDEHAAYRNYQHLLAKSGQQVPPELAHDVKTLAGTVARIASELGSDGTTYFIRLAGGDQLFTGNSDLSPKLVLTRDGDRVTVRYTASDEAEVPMTGFDNTDIPLRASPAQQRLQRRVEERRTAVAQSSEAQSARGTIANMSDEEVRRLLVQRDSIARR